MKRNLLALSAVVLAIGFSAFSPKFAIRYIVYDGSGAENSFSNYAVQSSSPGTHSTNTTIWWFRVDDANGTITEDEFNNTYFPAADANGNGSLSDQAESANLEKKQF
ncbi:hypothetical protein [Longitalea arenae]|uniref:hypothetical protein n=1 Tax=Longitalea arenae TaxID=2812558 RepID=UPI001967D7D7|nr:hypothetical protein [Longitalea arenae]